ncbi:unnamed protein product [Dracunculus medinensis]|uniref:Uncharacterized protein n=1 Tax=Dracunculus medinensis TaxID=318479 RepID=A0A3P7PSY7_DRAME|nr:unnamed protein product [Dracunculus medinensis]
MPVSGNIPSFPYANPLLAMGNPLLNPLMMNPSTAALASFANAAVVGHHNNPAATLSSLAAASTSSSSNATSASRQSPAIQHSYSPKLANNNRSTISPAVRLTVSPERPPSEAKDGSPPLQQPIQQQQHFGSAPPSCKSPIPTVAKVPTISVDVTASNSSDETSTTAKLDE